MKMVLEGIRVVDCTHFQVGPLTGQMLGDLGADVIHIEQKGVADQQRGFKEAFGVPLLLPGGRSAMFELCNRNKRSIALDLKTLAGKEILYEMVAKSDIFLCNFRSRAIKKLGLDYEILSQKNPRLIYGVADSFGSKGPDKDMPSFDIIIQARSGMMFNTGDPDGGPGYSSNGICDRMTGIMLAYGVLAAIIARERSGIGQEVHTSQLSAVMVLQGMGIEITSFTGNRMPRQKREQARNPLFNWYKCRDGTWIAFGLLLGNRFWPTFCKALGITHLENDPKFIDVPARIKNCEELIAILDKIFITKTYAEWEKTLKEAGDLIFSRCNDFYDLAADPQVVANNYFTEIDHPTLGRAKFVSPGFELSKTPPSIRTAPPDYGQHTEEVLLEYGYTWDDIVRFREQKAI